MRCSLHLPPSLPWFILSFLPDKTSKPMTCIYPVSELGEFKDEVSKEPQDFAFVLRMKIAAEHKRKDGIRGLKVSGC